MPFNDYSGCFSHCCKNCTKRFVGCHSKCEDYAKAKIDYEKQKEFIKKNRAVKIIKSDFNKVALIWRGDKK